MRTISARGAYLSGTVTPLVRATLRRLRLDFGSELYYKNDEQVIASPAYQGDDYNDQDGGNATIWGDSCVSTENGYKMRVIARAAWTSGGSTGMWRSKSLSGDNWGLTALTAPTTLHDYCRPGIYPTASGDNLHVWYVNTSHELTVRTLDTSAWTWGTASSALTMTTADSYAVHPVSTDAAVVVGFTSSYLWVDYCRWTGSAWVHSGTWVVHMSDDLLWSDAHWSDAEVSPSDSNKVVVALNLDRWGSAYTVLYDKTSLLWSQPKEVLPSAQEWGNLKVRVSGLCLINGRIWATTVREPVASGDIQMAHHVALASSTDGVNWRDEYFCTQSTLRGKLLYKDTDTYCYVVGNVSVARALATNRLGCDTVALKHTVSEAHGLSVVNSGVGAAPEVQVQATNADEELSDSGLLEAGNELTVELGASGSSFSDYCKALLAVPRRSEQWAGDEVALAGLGYASRILGGTAYRPVAAKNYQNPYSLCTNFTSDRGLSRISVRQVTGTWTTTKLPDLGRYALYCSAPGIALVPYELQTPSFLVRIAFKGKVSIEGNFIIFWYEDEENYWRAGLYLDGSQHKLVVQRYQNGQLTTKTSTDVTVGVGYWYALYVDARPGVVRAYFYSHYYDSGYRFDLGQSISYTTTGESGIPVQHHVGLECEDFLGFEGAYNQGTVDSATTTTMTDESKSFSDNSHGKWLRCAGQDRQVIDHTSTTLTISTPWADTPEAGDEWGLYTAETIDGPQMYVSELFVAEAMVPWTVDDIATSILELAGVTRDDVYPDGSVSTLSSSSPTAWDVDLKLTSSAATSSAAFWCSSYNTSGETAYSGVEIDVGASAVTMTDVENTGSGHSDAEVISHPALVSVPSAAKVVRVQAGRDLIVASVDGHFLTAFPSGKRQSGGYMARLTSGTCVTTEFPEMMDLIWDTNEPAAGALQRLLQGRRAKILERADGSAAISRFDTVLGDLGTYTVPLTGLRTGDVGKERIALVEMVGAEETAFYLDPTAARQELNYSRADNPVLATQEQALTEARRLAVLGRQRANSAEGHLYITDPAAELEDEFTVDGVDYIVDGYAFSVQLDEEGKPKAEARIAGRMAPDTITTGTYGSATYDGSTCYGG